MKDNFFGVGMNSWVIGWIASDGHNDGLGWSISQNIDDVDVLVQIKNLYDDVNWNVSFEGKNRYGKKPQVTIKRRSKEDSIELFNAGVPVGDKTVSLCFPQNLSGKATWLYLQGFFEGDGSPYIENYKYPRIGITTSYKWCYACKTWLFDRKIKSCISKDGDNAYCLYIHNLQGCKDFLTGIYGDFPNLKMSRKFAYAMKIITLMNYNERELERKNHNRDLYHNVCSKLNLGLSVAQISENLGCSTSYVQKVKTQKLGSRKEQSATKIEETKILLKKDLKRSEIIRKGYGRKLVSRAFVELYGSPSEVKNKRISQIRKKILEGHKIKNIVKEFQCSERSVVKERKNLASQGYSVKLNRR